MKQVTKIHSERCTWLKVGLSMFIASFVLECHILSASYISRHKGSDFFQSASGLRLMYYCSRSVWTSLNHFWEDILLMITFAKIYPPITDIWRVHDYVNWLLLTRAHLRVQTFSPKICYSINDIVLCMPGESTVDIIFVFVLRFMQPVFIYPFVKIVKVNSSFFRFSFNSINCLHSTKHNSVWMSASRI